MNFRTLAKERIEREVFTDQVRQNKHVIAKVIDIVDHNRNIRIIEKEIQDKMAEVQVQETSLQNKRAEQSQCVISLSVLIRQLQQQDPEQGMEDIFIDGMEDIRVHRARRDLGEITQLLRLLYTTDPTNHLPGELQQLVNNHTNDFN